MARPAVPLDVQAWGKSRASLAGLRGTDPAAAPDMGAQDNDERSQVVSIPPPEVNPIPTARDFFQQLKSATLAAGVGATVTTVPELRLKPGEVGVIKIVEIFVDAPTTLIDVTWALFVNGGPVPGFDNLSTFPRAATNLSIGFTGTIRLPPSAIVTMVITNNSVAGPWTVGAAYAGWRWNEQEGERYTGLPFLYVS